MSVAPTSVTVPTVQQYVSELATQLLVSPKPECLLCYVGRMLEQVVPTLRALGADPPRSPMSCRGWVSLDFEATMDRAMKGTVVSLPKIASYAEWVAARKALLVKEKEATAQRDRLNAERRELPMVEVGVYEFDGPEGKVSLLDLFEGRRQLIVYHFMFHPEWEEGCPSCTAGTDELSLGFLEHLHTRDTSYAMVSRAPLAKLERWKTKKGWDIPWYSSGESEFNYDFGVTIDASRGFDEFNFRSLDEYAAMGHESMKTSDQPYDMPGRTCFLQVDGRVFRTYSQYARGLESTGGSYYFLDLTALGRQEDWEEPKGRSTSARGNSPDFAS